MAILRDRLFLNANQHLAEHLQYPRESLIGQSTRMIHLDDDHYRHFGEEVYAQIAQGQPYTLEYPFRRRDGSITWMLISMSPMDLTKETREVAVVAVAIDNLRRARDEALAASRAKSGFLASVTHELRTPLNAIIGFTDLLLDHNPRPDQREHLAIVERSGQTLRRLIDDVLDLTRAESGRFPLNYQPIAPRDLLREALDSVRPSAARKGLELGLQTPSNLPAQLWLPADRLMQILLNLLNNAVKFSARGRVTLNSCFTPKNDALGTFTLEVTDTGPGIAPADQQRIFLPFEQLSNGILNDQGGTGLGLAISRQLAVAMGGSLEVKSAPGKGSRFRLELHEVMTLKPDAEILEEGRSAPAIQVAPAQVLIDRTEVAAPLEPSERQPAPADLPPPHELKPLLEQIDLGQITEATEWAEARQEAYPIFSEWLLRRLRACDLTALRSQLIELTQPDPTRSE
jgi:PAS domain S-box-containing protein